MSRKYLWGKLPAKEQAFIASLEQQPKIPENKQLTDYIKSSLHKGFPEAVIIQKLREIGHQEEVIIHHINLAKGRKV